MKTLVKFMIIGSADNRPPMLEKSMYDSWKSRMELYMENRENGRMIFDADNRPPMLEKSMYDSWKSRMELYMENRENGRMIFDAGLVFLVFTQGDDPIDCLNKAMAFIPLYKTTGLLCNKFKGGKDKVMPVLAMRVMLLVLGEQCKRAARVVKCYTCQGEGHMARQCTQTKRPRNSAWFKDKAMLAEA
nr:hypothetical protein [Tanacetum cinerariifolium]